jgi:hypothetical protein
MIRNFGEKAMEPWAFDKVPDAVRANYSPATWNSLSYRPSLPPMSVWGASSDFPPIYYEDVSKKAPVDELPKKQPDLFIPPELNKKNTANITLEAPSEAIPAKSFVPPELLSTKTN